MCELEALEMYRGDFCFFCQGETGIRVQPGSGGLGGGYKKGIWGSGRFVPMQGKRGGGGVLRSLRRRRPRTRKHLGGICGPSGAAGLDPGNLESRVSTPPPNSSLTLRCLESQPPPPPKAFSFNHFTRPRKRKGWITGGPG